MPQREPLTVIRFSHRMRATTASVINVEQALTIIGILEQPRRDRVECARGLASCLDQIRSRHPGITWMRQPINVRVVSAAGGVVVQARPPLPARLAEFCFFACCCHPDIVADVLRKLRAFVGGQAGWITANLSDVPQKIQPAPERIVIA